LNIFWQSCCFVAEYTEKADELKRDISTILSQQTEPSKQQKEEMAGKMRRLIEVVVNTHVFNGERHQYKQKTQSVSVFQKYTKVTRLTQAEAVELGDLFSKMSVTEHDDPRGAYVNTDKATFQTRFDLINSIEIAIISRK
jgi:predicted transcriptional regulator